MDSITPFSPFLPLYFDIFDIRTWDALICHVGDILYCCSRIWLHNCCTLAYSIPTPKGSISSEIPECSNFGASPTALDGEIPRGASKLGSCGVVDTTGLADVDADKGVEGSAIVGSKGKPLSEAELSFPSGSTTRGKGGNAAAIPPTAKESSSGGRRAPGRTCVRAVFHGLSTRTEGIPPLPALRGDDEGEEGKEGDNDMIAQGFTAVPAETLENVLALTACVTGGGSNREAFNDGEALRGDAELQSCNSPGLPLPLPASRARTSRALPYASCTAESAVPAPDESRSHTERMLPPAEPNKSEVAERAGRDPDPGARGLGTRTGASGGVGAGEDTGDGGRGCCCGSRTGTDREALVSGRVGSSSRFWTIDSADGGAGTAP